MKIHYRATGFVAAVAIAMVLPATPASAISAKSARTVVREESAMNRRVASHDARRRLRLFDRIPGGRPSASRPSGIGPRLRGQGPIPGDSRQVHEVGFLTFRVPSASVFRWLRRHPPRGSAARENRDGFVYWEHGPQGTRGATAVVRAFPRVGGGCVVRIDIYDSWELPRSPATRLPSGSRFLELIIYRSRGNVPAGGAKPLRPRRTATADLGFIDDLVRIANRQPAFQLFQPPSCGPMTVGRTQTVVFRFKTSRRGRVLAQLSQDLPMGLCDPLELRLGRGGPYELEGDQNLLQRAHRLLVRATPST